MLLKDEDRDDQTSTFSSPGSGGRANITDWLFFNLMQLERLSCI